MIPICIPRGELIRQTFDGAVATVVGWGTTRYGGGESSKQLEAKLPVWRNEDCNRAYFQPITDTFLCAGYARGGIDACQVRYFFPYTHTYVTSRLLHMGHNISLVFFMEYRKNELTRGNRW